MSEFFGARKDIDDFELMCYADDEEWLLLSKHRTRTDGGQGWRRWHLPLEYKPIFGFDVQDLDNLAELSERIVTGRDPEAWVREHGGWV